MREAMRLIVEEGRPSEEVARRLEIEPLKLRRWESAYHQFMQRDLNEGEALRDSNAQLHELPAVERNRFSSNWDDMMAKFVQRKIKLSPWRRALMRNRLTGWLFRGQYGELDYGSAFGAVLAAVALALVGVFLLQSGRNQAAQTGSTDGPLFEGPPSPDPTVALERVIEFLRAPTIEEKLQFVRGPTFVEPLMRNYYSERPEEMMFSEFGFVDAVDKNFKGVEYVLIGLVLSNESIVKRPVNLALEHRRDGYFIDWEVSVGYENPTFEQFLASRTTQPTEFRVVVKNGSYYNYDFADPERFHCFELTPVDGRLTFFGYAEQSSPSGVALGSLLEIVESFGAIVKLRFPPRATVENQVEIIEVVEDSWFREFSDSG